VKGARGTAADDDPEGARHMSIDAERNVFFEDWRRGLGVGFLLALAVIVASLLAIL
jgi:hypothetical protein